eukprot:1228580-Alexandrium_andersonii.AAC.1
MQPQRHELERCPALFEGSEPPLPIASELQDGSLDPQRPCLVPPRPGPHARNRSADAQVKEARPTSSSQECLAHLWVEVGLQSL